MSDEEKEKDKTILDLSKRKLKKVPKQDDAQNIRVLILDENELQKIDNIDSYLKIEKLSLCKNQLLRMYGVCRLHCLRELNLSFNGILSIDGLKDCTQLRILNLEGNNIKTIDHLSNNTKLEYLNLSENSIGSVSDISFLKNLKELYLHGNRLTHLRQCDKYLPVSLEVLTLAKNNISDLNEICSLTNLVNLHSITINDNPCVCMNNGPGGMDGFDYRPFVLNWCMSVKVIDGFEVDPIESLKAEWLYSQGRGRQFRLGEQAALAKYLSSVCPLIGKALETENERKLRLILSKAQHHQRQLQEEISENSNNSCNNSPSSGRKKPTSRIQSPRFSRLSGRQGSPDSMISSYHGTTSNANDSTNNSIHAMQMTTSLIENIKNDSFYETSSMSSSGIVTKTPISQDNLSRSVTPNQYNEQSHVMNSSIGGGPLTAASKMVPVPETLMSPDVCPASVVQKVSLHHSHQHLTNNKIIKNKDNKMSSPKVRSPHMKRSTTAVERSPNVSPRKTFVKQTPLNMTTNSNQINSSNFNEINQKARFGSTNANRQSPAPDVDGDNVSSEDDSDHINIDKLKTIRNKAAQRYQEKKDNLSVDTNEATESSAVMIQKIWRGYRTRKKTKDIAEKLLKKRTQEYIEKLTKDMEMTKVQLENERKIQQLQMQAINALWKRISSMQTLAHVQARVSGSSIAPSSNSGATELGPSDNDSKVLCLDNSSTAIVNDLTKTCSMLTTQVQQLQGSMRDILNCLTVFCNLPHDNVKNLLSAGVSEALAAGSGTPNKGTNATNKDSAGTQTEITAVHTPQIENQTSFPFICKVRPSTLPLDGQNAMRQTSIGTNTVSTTTTTTGTCTANMGAFNQPHEIIAEILEEDNLDDCNVSVETLKAPDSCEEEDAGPSEVQQNAPFQNTRPLDTESYV